ncbi:MAG: hypothetical protein JNL11_08115 [Bdellovibrionaceae bacterium]|nr:hypothetical protein [Pseudobdellovibrionaceae bacterium]
MAKIDKKKSTHKANAISKSSKPAPKASARPSVINKGPKKKLEIKKKEFKPQGRPDKSPKPVAKVMNSTKPKSFSTGGKKFELKKSGSALGFKAPKKEIKIEQSSKQEYLKKKELKKKEQEKSQLLRKEQTVKPDTAQKIKVPVAPVEAAKSKKADTKATAVSNRKAKKPKEENELDDVFIDDVGSSEIEEYEDELKAVEELDNESDDDLLLEAETKEKKYEDVELTDAEGNKLCRSRDCDQIAAVDGYCRYHYLLFWKNIQVRKKILADGKLGRYIEELTSRYPDKFLEMIRRDLRTQKDFLSAIQELEIDESNLDGDFEEDTQSYIDEVRGVNEGSSIEEEFE